MRFIINIIMLIYVASEAGELLHPSYKELSFHNISLSKDQSLSVTAITNLTVTCWLYLEN